MLAVALGAGIGAAILATFCAVLIGRLIKENKALWQFVEAQRALFLTDVKILEGRCDELSWNLQGLESQQNRLNNKVESRWHVLEK